MRHSDVTTVSSDLGVEVEEGTHSWREEEIDFAVKQCLVRVVSSTEALQEAMCQLHDFLHSGVLVLKKQFNFFLLRFVLK